MSDDSSQVLRHLFDRIRSGDRQAQEELLRAVCGRLEVLTRRMLRRYPAVRAWEQTTDVLQQALLRLMHSLQKMEVAGARDFYALATVHIRRVLIDLARRYGARCGPGNPDSLDQSNEQLGNLEPVDDRDDPEQLARWTALHEAVETLPCVERETFSLIFYHGWTHAQVAELFAVDERTVRRRWRAACQELHTRVGGELPD
jgi:RNA polymerase sigma factor (sigma-70 family)